MDSHKHGNTSIYEPRAYETPKYGILISTLIQAYMSVLMRWILISTLIQAYKLAYEMDSHKHANTSIYERAYERDSHKHANTSIYTSVLMRGILISTLTDKHI